LFHKRRRFGLEPPSLQVEKIHCTKTAR
jgi:hypothetical protein